VKAGLGWYLATTAAAWFPAGIQLVLFPYLVVVHLEASAARVGVAQMASQLPVLALILWGGVLGDRLDQRRLLVALQVAMALPPLAMALLLAVERLGYASVIAWGLASGTLAAFAQPARDAMASRVAGRDVQGTVTLALGVQFAALAAGFGAGAVAEALGPGRLLIVQAFAALLAAAAAARVRVSASAQPAGRAGLAGLGEGLRIAWQLGEIRAAVIWTFAVGLLFAGSFMVLLPLMVRELYAASAGGIAAAFAASLLGTCATVTVLMVRGGVARPGRWLLLGGAASAVALGLLWLKLPAWLFHGVLFFWGAGGGLSVVLARAIVQERAPQSHRGRVLALYALALLAGVPLGSLAMGWAVAALGVRGAVLLPAVGMLLTAAALHLTTRLWRLSRHALEPASS
jgi:MFS family permease